MKTENKELHTAGPWLLGDPLFYTDSLGKHYTQQILHPSGRAVMRISHDGSEEAYANARLMTTSLELLNACKKASLFLQCHIKSLDPALLDAERDCAEAINDAVEHAQAPY